MKINTYQYAIGVFVLLMLTVEMGIARNVEKAQSWKNSKKTDSRFLVNGQIEQGFGADWNFDVDDESKESILNLEPSVELGVTYTASKNTLGYLNIQYGREFEIEEESDANYTPSFEVDEGFVRFSNLFEIDNVIRKTSLTVGRYGFSDNREWFYDKSLDGILFSAEFEPLETKFSLSINREELIGSDLLRHNEFDPVNNFMLVAEQEPFKDLDIKIIAYTIVRDDRSDNNQSPVFYGLSSAGKLADKRYTFWTDFSLARGEDDDEEIKGYGLDIGGTMSFDKAVGPYVTLGYAFGSGGGDTDSDFRQTDLQGNSDKWGGVTAFKYYGELLDPELSNMHIFTAGIGYRFSPGASVDFVIHHYRQHVALDELRSSDLDADPDGEHKDLGNELDIVIGLGLSSNVETEFVLGYFQPGAAFEDNDDAFLLEATLTYNF